MNIITKIKEHKSIPWNEKTVRQKTVSVAVIAGFFVASTVVAFALGTLVSHNSEELIDTGGRVHSSVLNIGAEGTEVTPGSERTISPTITNTGNEKIYAFIRFECPTVTDNATEEMKSAYTFTPDAGTNWVKIEDEPGVLIYCYGNASEATEVQPGETVTLSGTYTLDVTNLEFMQIQEFKTIIHGCTVSVEGTNSNPELAYQAYINNGGE